MELAQQNTIVIPRLEIQKGVRYTRLSQMVSSPIDLRGSTLLGEIRRISPGVAGIEGFGASTKEGSNQIKITPYPASNTFINVLKQTGISKGDFITIEGAGIYEALVEAVTYEGLVHINQEAKLTLNITPFSVRSAVIANFNFKPFWQSYALNVTTLAEKGATSVKVSVSSVTVQENSTYAVFRQYKFSPLPGLPIALNAEDKLVFRGSDDEVVTVALSADAAKNSSELQISALSSLLPQGATAILSASSVVLRSPIKPGDKVAQVYPLDCPIGDRAILTFAVREQKGWRVSGRVVVANSVLENSLEIPIFPLLNTDPVIPQGSIAYTGTIPLKSFYAVLEGEETDKINTGKYAGDIISVSSAGIDNRLVQFTEIEFTDNWTNAN